MFAGQGCPSDQELSGFLLGEVAPAEAEALARHLETCQRCSAAMNELRVGDTFLDALRRAGQAPEAAKTQADLGPIYEMLTIKGELPGSKLPAAPLPATVPGYAIL